MQQIRKMESSEWRWLYATIITIFLLFMTIAVRSLFIHYIENNWEERKTEIDSTQATAIGQRLDNAVRFLLEYADAGSMAASRAASASDDFMLSIAESLSDCEEHRISFELRNNAGKLLRYSGQGLQVEPIHVDSGVQLIEATPYTMLVHTRLLYNTTGAVIGSLAVGFPFRVTVPVNRRFSDAEGLVESLSDEFELDLRPEPLPLTRRPSERVYVPFSYAGSTLAVLSFEGAMRNVYVAEIELLFNRVIVFLLFALMIIVSLPLFRAELRISQSTLAIFFIGIHCWGLRYLLHITNAPTLLLPTSVMDPVSFASSFGNGIASSPGDVLFSVFTVLVNAAFIFVRIRKDRERPVGFITSLALLSFAGILLPIATRALAAILRSFVIDSPFNYDDVSAQFDDPVHILMIVNAWLLALSYSFILSAVNGTIYRALASFHGITRFVLHVAPLLLAVILFLFITNDSILPWWFYCIGTTLFILLHYLPWHKGEHSLSGHYAPFILAAAAGSVITMLVFSTAMETKRSAEIEVIAGNLSRPIDAWSHVLMEQTLQEIARMHISTRTTRSARPAYETAFRIWSASPLSRLENNSALLLIDSSGQLLSRFAVGNDPFLLSMHTLSTTIDKTEGIVQSAYRRFDDREKRYYKGYTDLNSDSSRIIAVVVLEALDPMQISHSAVDLLRNTTTAQSLAPEDHFVISRFSGNQLTQTTDPQIQRALSLPTSVSETLAHGQASTWGFLTRGSDRLHTYFINLTEDDTVLAISKGSQDTMLSLYRWLRIAFIFTVLSLVSLGLIYIIHRRHVRVGPRTFSRKLQVSLLAVAAIPLLLIWIAGRDFVLDITTRDIQQQVMDNLDILRSNILYQLPDGIDSSEVASQLTDQLCQDIRLRTGKDVNVFDDATLIGTSKPELYHTGLLNNRLNPDAWGALVIGNKDVYLAREQIGEFSYYVGYRALRNEHGVVSAIISTPTLFERNRAEEVYIRASAAVLLWITVMGVIVLIVSTAMSRQISRPLKEFLYATQDITSGNLTRKVQVRGSAEFVDLMSAFNTMTERLRQSKEELAAAERELAWKEMARQVAHEIRNPLTPMKLSAQHLLQAWRDRAMNIGDIIEKVTKTLIDQINTLSHISDEFSRFGRMPKRVTQEILIAQILEKAVSLFRTHEDINFILNIEPGLPVILGDKEELARAITNLLRNAVQAIHSDGKISITAKRVDNTIHLLVEDNGSGIPSELLPRIFEPNFSTKTEGMGLGLAIVRKTLNDIGGTIRIESETGQGTQVSIILPLATTTSD